MFKVRVSCLGLFVFALVSLLVSCKSHSQSEVNQVPVAELLSTPVGQKGKWRLVFRDEFEGDRLDDEKWVTCHWWNDRGCTIATNNELQWYRPGNVSVKDGLLRLQAREASFVTSDGRRFAYTSGMVSTGRLTFDTDVPPRFAEKHIYVEMRAKIPTGKGLWPAFWMLPSSNRELPEIDVMEILGDKPDELHMTFHYLDSEGDYNAAGHDWKSPVPLSDWHVYALDWQPRGITWYFDGKKKAFFSGDANLVPDEPMYLIANLAVGGDWAGDPDQESLFPSTFEIDYIRVWMRA